MQRVYSIRAEQPLGELQSAAVFNKTLAEPRRGKVETSFPRIAFIEQVYIHSILWIRSIY